ncbi:MAG: TM0106 family RecB-like putative nuclease [Candidatus Kuenenia sp.]|nr:TM0106 family RecB-like putative nuclease [Candidatus Kuenenia hertensis]
MHYENKTLKFSPTDLIQFAKSPFASWMQRKYLEEPDSVQPDEEDPQLKILQKKGEEHEAAYLAALQGKGYDVCKINSGDKFGQTLDAINKGRQIIYQARLMAKNFAGYADFLKLEKSGNNSISYSIWDTKLSRHVKPYFLIQLCCYAEMLEVMTSHRPGIIGIVLGNGEEKQFRTSDFFYYYKRIKSAFLDLMDNFPGENPPVPYPMADHGEWKSHAEQIIKDMDHLSQVANITKVQISKLTQAGIDTMTKLVTTTARHVRKIGDEVFARLKEQAHLQAISANREKPEYKILQPPEDNPKLGLAALPPESPMDIFFDMEGYPYEEDWLEYLFGAVYIENGEPKFTDWWAHNPLEEKKAFESFIDWVVQRWQIDPSMHIYHYAAYEQTALKRLMNKYGTREDRVDDLLRNNVFVDLYNVVRHGIRVGEPRYSIKNLEHLYMDARKGKVIDAGASLVYYDAWIESKQSKDWKASALLKSIRDYNEDDCHSTCLLAKWLREKQSESGIRWAGTAINEKEAKEEERTVREEVLERQRLADTLLSEIPHDHQERAAKAEHWRVQELLAWLLEFHRRCDKSMWWELFERHEKTEHELMEDIDCLAGITLKGAPKEEKQSLLYKYTFDPAQETKLGKGDSVNLVPDIGVIITISGFDNNKGELELKISKRKLEGLQGNCLPGRVSLIPYEFVNSDVIVNSIFSVVKTYHETGALPYALTDFIYRKPPNFKSCYKGLLVRPNESNADAAIRLARDLNNSCLCIQGPPGTGKTYTAAKVISSLLSDGKNIGITSNSHKAILNLMRAVCQHSPDTFSCIKAGGEKEDPLFEEYKNIKHESSSEAAAKAYNNGLIGGTAWFFSREDMVGKIDYLFVDEAGQVSVANLAGMARSTNNIILLGDQMQLKQPVKGVHPGESGQSILEYYLQDHATIPPEQGIFLETTWRMHPDICTFISEAVYEGKLKPEPHTKNRVVKIPKEGGRIVRIEAGILFIPVEHEGNVQGSDEEVGKICEIVDDLKGRTLTDEKGNALSQVDVERDILFVAPYNMQVHKLRRSLPEGARIASVDKFQGQEAPIVIISMCASKGEFGLRGMEFILDRHRLNVAISRARSLAIVVGDPRLAEADCTSVAGMEQLNLYSWLQDIGILRTPI